MINLITVFILCTHLKWQKIVLYAKLIIDYSKT